MTRPLLAALAAAVVLAGCTGTVAGPEGDGGAAAPTASAPAGEDTAEPSEQAAGGSGDWVTAADAPLPRTEVAGAAFAGRVWVAGGFTADGQPSADVQVYDPRTGAWTAGPALPRAVHHAALVAAGDRLVVLGGYVDGWVPSSAVWVLPRGADAWVEGPRLPEPRGAGAAAYDGERVVYGGGVGPGGVAAQVWALEALDGEDWRALGTLQPAREHLGAASDGAGRTWFLGGREGGLDRNRGEVDLVSDGRVEPAGALPTPRGGVTGFYAPGVGACMAGGEAPEGTFTEVECLTDGGDAVALPPLAEPRHGLGAAVLDGTAFVLLGGPEPGLTVSGTLQTYVLP